MKAEWFEKGPNSRFVMTNLSDGPKQNIEFAKMRIQQLRLRLLKVGTQVKQSARRMWFRLASGISSYLHSKDSPRIVAELNRAIFPCNTKNFLPACRIPTFKIPENDHQPPQIIDQIYRNK